MDHELVLENSNSAAIYTLLNAIIYLKAMKYLNSSLRHLLSRPGTYDKGAEKFGSNAVLWL